MTAFNTDKLEACRVILDASVRGNNRIVITFDASEITPSMINVVNSSCEETLFISRINCIEDRNITLVEFEF